MPVSPFLNEIRAAIRVRNYSLHTEKAYVDWAKRFIRYHGNRHPEQLHDTEVMSFLTHLAVSRNVAASTQNQALNALVFMYRHVLSHPLGDITDAVRARQPRKLPVVLTRNEVTMLLQALNGVHRLIAALLYGSRLRAMECIRLRVKDIDFNYCCLHIHDGKGQKDRIVTLSSHLKEPLSIHLKQVKLMHMSDLTNGLGRVYLPNALPFAPCSSNWVTRLSTRLKFTRMY